MLAWTPFNELFFDPTKNAPLAPKSYKLNSFFKTDPSKFTMLMIERYLGGAVDNCYEDGGDSYRIAVDLIELLAGIGGIQSVRRQAGLFGKFT